MADFFKKIDKKKDKDSSPFKKPIIVLVLIFILLIAILVMGHNLVNLSNKSGHFSFFPNTKKALHMDEKETVEQETEIPTLNSSSISDDDFVLKTVNVGQGLNLIMSCEGENAMYDGGEYFFRMEKEIVDERNKVWDNYDRFKYVFLSHYDSDHAGGLMDVIYNKKIDKFIKPRYRAYTKTYSNINMALKKKQIKNVKAKVKKVYKLGSAKIKILRAEKKSYDENDNSVVLKVTHGNVSYLITGDLTHYGEYKLTQFKSTEKQLSSTVLIVGHHGSSHSSNPDFLGKVLPYFSVISVGKNDYGHPDDGVLVSLKGIKHNKILRTDEKGTITIWDDGKKICAKGDRDE